MKNADDSVENARLALSTRPAGHPQHPAALAKLADALRIRYERTGAEEDLHEAVEVGRRAGSLATKPWQILAILSNLSIALRLRYQMRGDSADVEAAVDAGRRAAELLLPDDPSATAVLSNLASAHQVWFDREGDPSHLDLAIDLGRQAVACATQESPHYPRAVSNTAIALLTRAERTGDSADADEAVSLCQDAVRTTPPDDPERAGQLNTLAAAHLVRYSLTADIAARHRGGIEPGDRLLLAAWPADQVLFLHPPAALDEAFTTVHSKLLGGHHTLSCRPGRRPTSTGPPRRHTGSTVGRAVCPADHADVHAPPTTARRGLTRTTKRTIPRLHQRNPSPAAATTTSGPDWANTYPGSPPNKSPCTGYATPSSPGSNATSDTPSPAPCRTQRQHPATKEPPPPTYEPAST